MKELKHFEMFQTFYVEHSPEVVIIAGSFLLSPDIENASSDIFVYFKWQEKHIQEKGIFQPVPLCCPPTKKYLGSV